jgi:hypothetical protein
MCVCEKEKKGSFLFSFLSIFIFGVCCLVGGEKKKKGSLLFL